MKIFSRSLTFSICLLLTSSVFGAVNIAGYYNLVMYPGDNLIANQLDNRTTNGASINYLDSVLINGDITAGTTFTKWDSAANAFLPVSTFDGSSWSINYSFNFGEGALLHTATQWTNTFVGNVYPAAWLGFGGTNIWSPNYANGLHLISSPLPLSGNMDIMFTNAVGRLPQDGESVRILNAASQSYVTTTFHVGSGWDNGNPTMRVGQAAWFNLGPVVPEPGSAGVLGAGLVVYALRRRGRQGKSHLGSVTRPRKRHAPVGRC